MDQNQHHAQISSWNASVLNYVFVALSNIGQGHVSNNNLTSLNNGWGGWGPTANDSDVTRSVMTSSELYYVPPGLVVFLSVLYGSVSVVSIVGNMLVILVVCRYKSMQTVTNFFIANLR